MTVKQLLLALALTLGLAGTAYLARETETTGQRMAAAAEKFLAGLEPAQKERAAFKFDVKERTRWFFTPQQSQGKATRKGLPLVEMTDKQKGLALDLLKASAGEAGYKKAAVVMSLESILHDLEKRGAMVRNPEWYFVTVFGEPSKTGKWGWRFEGHHLSLNFTIDGGKVISATPCFYGSNPAVVKGGAKKGLETLPESEEPFRALVALLDADQKKVAQQAKQFREIEEAVAKPGVGAAVGLPAAKMDDKQKAALQKLIEGYAARMQPAVAAAELAEIKKAGLDAVHFAYAGDGTPGKPHSYRVQGPTFVIELVNEQRDSAGNPANHIHSSWRNVQGDFGLAGS
jgi:hypothetical protein